ncbi:MAG: adenylate/guanylate cyclase domain-containing protein, partial [Balneolaceae bacterium]|nr:adenylate/guanylate cyclase domain-containing protein [Balneolaceae bacterium]
MDDSVMHIDWNWQLNSSAEELWPLLSDTNRLNGNLNLPPVQNSDISYDHKEGFTQLSYRALQHAEAWEEEPYEWERPYRFGVKRHYKNGAFRQMKIQVDLLPNDRGTRVRFQIWATTRNLLSYYLEPLKLRLFTRMRLKKTLMRYDRMIQEQRLPYTLETRDKLHKDGRQRVAQYREELISATERPDLVSKLINFVRYARDIDLVRISPYRLADHWSVDRQEVLTLFLYATDQGLLNFNWDLYCPECRSHQQRCKTLSQVHEPVFCNECQQEFTVNFNHNIRLSFRPNPLIRNISEQRYCLTGPGTSPHIAVKQYLKPGDKRYLKVNLKPGEYILHTEGHRGEARVFVEENGRENVSVTVGDAGFNGETVRLNPKPNLVLENRSNETLIFQLEKKAWSRDTPTAARVTSLQLFRTLFDKEVLRKGEKIAVDGQTLMFTDLFDSTGMYNKEGDATAVGRVIEHFKILQQAIASLDGAVVKTIGDSVMAVFSKPADAYRAILKAQKMIAADSRFKQRIKLKAGIHHGSCMAVNLNNSIDYFGS